MKLLLISLQKSGAAPRDSLEFSNALCELHTEHDIIIAAGNELKKEFISNRFRTVKIIPTFSSSPFSFIFWSCTLIRPLRLLSLILQLTKQPTNQLTIFTTHFHPWLWIVARAHSVLKFRLAGRSFSEVRWFAAAHENPFGEKETRNSFSKNLEQSFLKSADTVVCYSDFVRSELITRLPDKLITALPLGAYISATKDIKIDPRFAEKTKPLIACIGRIEPYKGISDLVDAFQILKNRGVNANLLIAGRGELDDDTRYKIHDLGVILENRWLTPAETAGFVAGCDLLVLPYRQASQSGMISLALAIGRPVIATEVGGLPEQVDDGITGKLVPPGNPHVFADAIQELLKDPEKLAQMGLKARVLGSTRLSWKRAGEIFLESL